MGFKTSTQQRSSKSASRPINRTASSSRSRPPAYHLQRAIGNSATSRFFSAGHIQPKLTVSNHGDASEREADRVADEVMRMPEPQPGLTVQRSSLSIQRKCTKCKEELKSQPLRDEEEKIVQAKLADTSAAPEVSSGFESHINNIRGGGEPLPESVRAFFEPRFDYDLSQVRVHTDDKAGKSARAVNAAAFTVGRDIVFGAGAYAPGTTRGRRLLAHELAHTIQQARDPSLRRTIQRASLDQFKTDLEAMSPNHAAVVGTLFGHPTFIPLATFLRNCPAGAIEFEVRRIREMVRGRQVDLFGGFSPSLVGPSTMTVNPQRPEHASNPIEVVDTVVHEFIHAILGLRGVCESAANPFPLAADVLDAPQDPELGPLFTAAFARGDDPMDRTVVASLSAAGIRTLSGGSLLEYFDRTYGPSASRPETHYIDLNRKGLELVTSIMADIRSTHPTIGRETVSFDNVELFQAEAVLGVRSWWNSTQRAFSMSLHKDRVARKRKIDPTTFTEREYDISAIQVVEFADRRTFDPNTSGGWGPVGGVWECHKQSRFTGKELHTYVTGVRASPPGGAVDYKIIQHT